VGKKSAQNLTGEFLDFFRTHYSFFPTFPLLREQCHFGFRLSAIPHASAAGFHWKPYMRKVLLAVVALYLLTLTLLAQDAPPSADTFVNSASPTTNYGSNVIDVVGPGASTFLKFNLAEVPAGATVKKATLRLYVDAVSKSGQFDGCF
jgi:hypothetical protein